MTKLDDIRDRLVQRQIERWFYRRTFFGRLCVAMIVAAGVGCLLRWLVDHGVI